MKHAMIVNLMNGKLHLAPLENPQAVLMWVRAPGIWAIDSMSLRFGHVPPIPATE